MITCLLDATPAASTSLASQFWLSFVAGIVSAVTLSFVIWLVRVVWTAKISPLWENSVYSDARIEGVWETLLVSEIANDYKERATIRQIGHNIEGELECISGPDKGRSYKFKGVVKNTIVSAYYWNSSKTALDSGSFTLRIEENGNRLQGYTAYYFDTDHTLKSRPYCWERIRQLKIVTNQPCEPKGNNTPAERVGADQPATGQESKRDGDKKPKPESEGRSQ